MTGRLAEALEELRTAVADVHLPLPIPGAERASAEANAIGDQLSDYVLPRLARLDAPLLVVVGGSTGAGKSTLVNSLVGRQVSTSGVIRPTTRHPVLVHNSEDAHWFTDQRILPGLARTTGEGHEGGALRLVAEPTLPRGLAILDAPDIDSVVDENRALAGQLLAAADMWLFVTSAARYADAVPWDFLNDAAHRQVVVGVVLDRVPPAGMRDIPGHLGQMMAHRGLGRSPLFAVPETTVDAQGILPNAAVAPIRGWLASLVTDEQSRQEVVRATLTGAITDATRRAPAIAAAVDEQVAAITRLRDDANSAYDQAVKAVTVRTADGTLLRGEVLARWHEFVGTGEFMRAVEKRISLLRDRMMAALRGQPPEADQVKVAVESGLEALVIEEGRAAAERAEAAWRGDPAGRFVLDRSSVDLAGTSHDFDDQVARMIREWQRAVLETVSEEGGRRRLAARYLALGVNGIAATLMVLVFTQTGGLTGAEVGIAGGSVALAQSLLEAVFGDENVRRMAKKAKEDLDERIEVLMSSELLRYHQALVVLQVRPQQADEIRDAARNVAAAAAGGPIEGAYVEAAPERASLSPGEPRALSAGESTGADTRYTGEPGEPADAAHHDEEQ
ncbi:dynamin family protein [Raineyella fluvialis]|uniref:ABC transporter n=1 Tax=Raineyella fluvialis TaxID=2662261 RepID=A0A5Q2FCF9_9ACTN|nr:dynamin family protein [Raineyella fluvialis]QGF22385.1 ABC transporter [Raineyella fluvialis]